MLTNNKPSYKLLSNRTLRFANKNTYHQLETGQYWGITLLNEIIDTKALIFAEANIIEAPALSPSFITTSSFFADVINANYFEANINSTSSIVTEAIINTTIAIDFKIKSKISNEITVFKTVYVEDVINKTLFEASSAIIDSSNAIYVILEAQKEYTSETVIPFTVSVENYKYKDFNGNTYLDLSSLKWEQLSMIKTFTTDKTLSIQGNFSKGGQIYV